MHGSALIFQGFFVARDNSFLTKSVNITQVET